MANKDDPEKRDCHDSTVHSGWPVEVYERMKQDHDKFMNSVDHVHSSTSALHNQEESNPFVAFKSFIDLQFGALVDSFRSLPDNVTELRKQMEEERERRNAERATCLQRWTHVEDESPDHFAMRIDRSSNTQRESAFQAALAAISASNQLNARVSREKIHALYRDEHFPYDVFNMFSTPMLSPGGASEYMQENGNNGYNQVATSNATLWRWPSFEPSWLSIDWFRRSTYSPIHLESASLQADVPSFAWRQAFEDLIDTTLNKPWSKRRIPATLSGLEWVISLHRQGVLPPQLPSMHSVLRNASEAQKMIDRLSLDHVNDGKPHKVPAVLHSDLNELIDAHLAAQKLEISTDLKRSTETGNTKSTSSVIPLQRQEYQQLLDRGKELSGEDFSRHHLSFSELFDMIERMEQESEILQLDERTIQKESTAQNTQNQNQTQISPPHEKIDVLSSLTTTHTTRHPDGTVTTKIVLKQRFADGREETQEKIHTYSEPLITRTSPKEGEMDANNMTDNAPDTPVKSSWFWK